MLKLNHRSTVPLLAWAGLVGLSWNAPVGWLPSVARAAEVNWEAIEWTPLDDKAQSGIDWRFAPGIATQGDAVEWNYQFRNRYQKSVKFQSTLSYEDTSGALKTEVKSWVIGPQEIRGATLIGKKLGAVEISKPEVAKPTETATASSPERQATPQIDARAEAVRAEAERTKRQEAEQQARQQAEIARQAEIAAENKRQNEIAARQAREAEKQQQETARQAQETQRLEAEKARATERKQQENAAQDEANANAAEQQRAVADKAIADKAIADKAAAQTQALEAAKNALALQQQQEEARKAQLAKQQQQAEERLQQAEARAQQAELRARQAEEREKQVLEKARLEAQQVPAPVVEAAQQSRIARAYTPTETGAASKTERAGAPWRLAPQTPLAGHANAAGALAFSPDGTLLASCSWRQINGAQSSEIILRDVLSGQILQNLEGRWQTTWNGKGAKPPWVGHWGKVNSLAFSPDGTQLASGGEDGRITLWDVKGGKALKTLEKSPRPVLALSYVSLQNLTALSRDGKVLMWNLTDNRVQTLPLGTSNSGDWVRVGAFSRDGAQVATGDGNGALTIWNVPGGSLARRINNSLHQDLEQPQGVEATALAFSPDGQLLISANHAHIYLNSVQKSADFPDYRAKVLFAGQRVRQLVWASDSQSALAVGEGKGILVNPRGKTAAEANLGELTAPGTAIREVAISPLQNTFASGGAEGNVVLWK